MKSEDRQLWEWFTRKMQGPVAALNLRHHPRKLDLHGLTLQQAYAETKQFLNATPHNRIIVITGRSGEIAKEFPHWVEGWFVNPLPNGGSFELSRSKTQRRRS